MKVVRRGGVLVRLAPRCRERAGQSAVEFAIAVPVFLLFIFGIMQVALVLRMYIALNQAATDAAHVIAAQSSTLPANLTASWQADAPALQAIRAALASQNLAGIQSITISSIDSSGNPENVSVTASDDLSSSLSTALSVTLTNTYHYSPANNGSCQVDQFTLVNPLNTLNPSFSACALPWNGEEYDEKTNQNGRDDQRCTEDRVLVKITYTYTSFTFPVRYNLTLVGQDSTILEPRQFLGDSATFQSSIPSC